MVYWFTGQPGAGKTTLAEALKLQLFPSPVIHIDGDHLRDIFVNKDYSETGRKKNIERAQDIALFLSSTGYDVVVSLVSPYREQREEFKKKTEVKEIYVHAFTDRGRTHFHVPDYEPPVKDFIDIDTTNATIMESVKEILKNIKK